MEVTVTPRQRQIARREIVRPVEQGVAAKIVRECSTRRSTGTSSGYGAKGWKIAHSIEIWPSCVNGSTRHRGACLMDIVSPLPSVPGVVFLLREMLPTIP